MFYAFLLIVIFFFAQIKISRLESEDT